VKRAQAQRLDELHPIHLGHAEVEHDGVERLQGAVPELEGQAAILGLDQLVCR
jgi:hypothetical protein